MQWLQRNRIFLATLAGLGLLLFAVPSYAELLQFSFGGLVTSVREPGVSHFAVGDTLTGLFAIDTSVTTILTPGDPSIGDYEALRNFSVTTSRGYQATSTGGIVFVSLANSNYNTGDYLIPAAFSGSPYNLVGPNVILNGSSWRLGSFAIVFQDPTGTALSSNSIPDPLDLTRFPNPTFQFGFLPAGASSGAHESLVSGTITTVAPVPLPAAFLLFVSGLMSIGILKRRAA